MRIASVCGGHAAVIPKHYAAVVVELVIDVPCICLIKPNRGVAVYEGDCAACKFVVGEVNLAV